MTFRDSSFDFGLADSSSRVAWNKQEEQYEDDQEYNCPTGVSAEDSVHCWTSFCVGVFFTSTVKIVHMMQLGSFLYRTVARFLQKRALVQGNKPLQPVLS